MGKKSRAKGLRPELKQLNFFIQLHIKMRAKETMVMTPREFEKATGQVMNDEVKLLHFSPDRSIGEPVFYNNGRLVINGVELLGIMHRDMFGEHDGGNWDPDTAEIGFGTPQNIN